jgi:hypothetical protein
MMACSEEQSPYPGQHHGDHSEERGTPHISGAGRVVYIGQHLPEKRKQKPVSETWEHDSNCELDSSPSETSVFLNNDTVFRQPRLLEYMQMSNMLQIWSISSRTYLNSSEFMEVFSLNQKK